MNALRAPDFLDVITAEENRLFEKLLALRVLRALYDVEPQLPWPATLPSVQDEAEGKHDLDQAAQKAEDGNPLSAEVDEHAARSRSFVTTTGTGEEARALADPVPVSDVSTTELQRGEPREDKPEATGECPEAPPMDGPRKGPSGTAALASPSDGDSNVTPLRRDQVLDLWANTTLSQREISEKLGCSRSTPAAVISLARKAGDVRAFARDPDGGAPSGIKNAPPKTEAVLPTIRVPGVQFDAIGNLLKIDTKALVVAGPKGDWQTTRPVIKSMVRLKDGGLFDDTTIMEAGEWSESAYRDQLPIWTEKLRAIGFELVRVRPNMINLRRADA